MKNKTNISILDNIGLRRNAIIEIGNEGSYESGLILDANAIEKMVKNLIAGVVGTAGPSVDTLGEIAATIPTKVSDLNNDSGFITQTDLQNYIIQLNNVNAPVISGNPYNDVFKPTTTVSITGPNNARIYYTIDGSTPTTSSTLYTESFTIDDTTTVKAIAVYLGVSSDVTTKTFTLTNGETGDVE